MRVFAVSLMLWAGHAAADELPRNLLLKCEGKLTVLSDFLGKKDVQIDKFDTLVRLQDGELADTNSRWLTTRDCLLKNGVIGCKLKTVVPSSFDQGSEKRHLAAYITRETGEYDLFLQTWSYTGRNAKGQIRGTTQFRRAGICKPAGKPIF